MNTLIRELHPETHEAINNARTALQRGEITQEQYADFIRSCFEAEAANKFFSRREAESELEA